MTKVCCHCKEAKSVDCYDNHPNGRFGKAARCKECRKISTNANYLANREVILEKHYKWRARNKEKVRTHGREAMARKRSKVSGRITDMFQHAKLRATKSGREFNITPEYLLELWVGQDGKCALTDLPFNLTVYEGRRYDAPSLDRIDASGGYEIGNVRLVLWCVNFALSDWGTEIFDLMCAARIEQLSVEKTNLILLKG